MYIIELIMKKLTQKRELPTYEGPASQNAAEYESCEHTFMPLDSTNQNLSCIKCGLVVTQESINNETKNKNFFMRNSLD